jgi:hypothetical protein
MEETFQLSLRSIFLLNHIKKKFSQEVFQPGRGNKQKKEKTIKWKFSFGIEMETS